MSRAKASICVMIATIVTVMTLFFLPIPSQRTIRVTEVRSGALEMTCMLEGEVVYGEDQLLVSPADGRVAQVYAKAGDTVSEGQLLFRLEAQAETAALAMLDQRLYELRSQLEKLSGVDSLKVAGADYLLQLEQERTLLAATLSYKQIRAASDGVVENVYVKKGSMVTAGSLMGLVQEENVLISALWTGGSSLTPQAGMQAWWCASDGTPAIPLVLESVSAPVAQGTTGYVQQLLFRPVLQAHSLNIGAKAPVRLILQQLPETALVPLEAVDDQMGLWVVSGEFASPVSVTLGQSNGDYIQVSEQLLGQRVVLRPDENDLTGRLKIEEEQ